MEDSVAQERRREDAWMDTSIAQETRMEDALRRRGGWRMRCAGETRWRMRGFSQ